MQLQQSIGLIILQTKIINLNREGRDSSMDRYIEFILLRINPKLNKFFYASGDFKD